MDKHFRGAYSYQEAGITEDDYNALEHPIYKSLWFTGEYTGRAEEYGHTHSAYDGGYKVAGKILKCLKGDCPSELPKTKTTGCKL